MKRKKILNRLADFFDLKARKQLKHRKELQGLLKQLKEKKLKLQKKIEDEEEDEKRHRLNKELEVIRAQRRKGIKILKELQS